MKKTYLTPLAEPLSLVMESTFICASVISNSSNLTIDDEADGTGFWSY